MADSYRQKGMGWDNSSIAVDRPNQPDLPLTIDESLMGDSWYGCIKYMAKVNV